MSTNPQESSHAVRSAPLCAEKGARLAQRCKLAHVLRWEYSCKRLKLGQLLGQLGVFLTIGRHCHSTL
jgi:hypothetical protein